MLEYSKMHQYTQAAQLLLKSFDKYPYIKKNNIFIVADGLLVKVRTEGKIPSYVMQRSALELILLSES